MPHSEIWIVLGTALIPGGIVGAIFIGIFLLAYFWDKSEIKKIKAKSTEAYVCEISTNVSEMAELLRKYQETGEGKYLRPLTSLEKKTSELVGELELKIDMEDKASIKHSMARTA